MNILAGVGGVALILIVLVDSFESIILPRRVSRRFRLTRGFYRSTWFFWRKAALLIHKPKRRESYLSFYGPLSLLMLVTLWAVLMVLGFGLVHWALGSPVRGQNDPPGFTSDLYFSGSTFFTLGLGDVLPQVGFARFLAVLECGLGFAFLAAMIGYLPVIYGAFSKREGEITLMDARAGSPPSAIEMLVRHARSGNAEAVLQQFFGHWERWSSELLESHISYPLLAYYRSQHDNQSWLGALTSILDASATVTALLEGAVAWQAQLTFAMARHAVVDLSQILSATPKPPATDRLPPRDFERASEILSAAGVTIPADPYGERKLASLRGMYEPYVNSLSEYLVMSLPPWLPHEKRKENWLTSAWEHAAVPDQAVASVINERRP